MISKHIDLIAVGILLWGAALVSTAHRVQVLQLVPFRHVTIVNRSHPPRVAMPEMPVPPEPPQVHSNLD